MSCMIAPGFSDSRLWTIKDDHVVYMPQNLSYKETLKGGLPIEWFWEVEDSTAITATPLPQEQQPTLPPHSSIPEAYFAYEPPTKRSSPKKTRITPLPSKYPKKPKVKKSSKQLLAYESSAPSHRLCTICKKRTLDEPFPCGCLPFYENYHRPGVECNRCYAIRMNEWIIAALDLTDLSRRDSDIKMDCHTCKLRIERNWCIEDYCTKYRERWRRSAHRRLEAEFYNPRSAMHNSDVLLWEYAPRLVIHIPSWTPYDEEYDDYE